MPTQEQTIKDVLEMPRAANQSVMSIMNASGDFKVTWDRTRPDEVEAAQEEFKKWQATNRYTAYKVEGTSKGEALTKFDPRAESIIFAPRMQGG